MKHRHCTDAETILLLRGLKAEKWTLHKLRQGLARDGIAVVPDWAHADLREIRSCPFCWEQLEALWAEEDEIEEIDGPVVPEVVPLRRKEFRIRHAPAQAAGEAAWPGAQEPPAELTYLAEGVLVRVLRQRDGSAVAVLFFADETLTTDDAICDASNLILRADGTRTPFAPNGTLRLGAMPGLVSLERLPSPAP